MRMKATTRNKIALAFARYKELRASDVEAMIRAIEKPQGPVVIDVPFIKTGGRGADLQEAGCRGLEDAMRCVEIKADGRRCEDPRDEGSERCMRHTQWFRTNAMVMGLPCPEDAVGLQDFLVRVLALVTGGQFTPGRSAAILKVATLMQKNMREYGRQLEEARWARLQEAACRRQEAERQEGGGRREDGEAGEGKIQN